MQLYLIWKCFKIFQIIVKHGSDKCKWKIIRLEGSSTLKLFFWVPIKRNQYSHTQFKVENCFSFRFYFIASHIYVELKLSVLEIKY